MQRFNPQAVISALSRPTNGFEDHQREAVYWFGLAAIALWTVLGLLGAIEYMGMSVLGGLFKMIQAVAVGALLALAWRVALDLHGALTGTGPARVSSSDEAGEGTD
jgi:hypothetical protein